jgi:Acyl dehydratase
MHGNATMFPAMIERAFEDFPAGTRLESAEIEVTEESIIAFAKQFDPQTFHLDPAAAKKTIFGGLIASGWHTGAISMRLLVDTMRVGGGGIIGLGVDELRWPTPVCPGDRLRVEIEIIAARLCRSRPGFGIIQIRSVTRNQRDEVVQTFVASAMLPVRGSSRTAETEPPQTRGKET